jgi:hypothetical protein
MNRKYAAILSVLLILIFIGYIIFDTMRPEGTTAESSAVSSTDSFPDAWRVSHELSIKEGKLKAVTVSMTGAFYVGGDSFISSYDKDYNLIWTIKTEQPVTALSVFNDTIFASSSEVIHVMNNKGEKIGEWGPFEDEALITSVSASISNVVFADAGNKMVFVLDKKGSVLKLTGGTDGQFIVPSPYFDVATGNGNEFFVANTGQRRIETRDLQGKLLSYFGEAGLAAGAFCGCCNPAHFAVIQDGFVTAEKGLNRIKIIDKTGKFVEFVSAKNNFTPSVPLDLASDGGKLIYAANPADSKLYVYKRN